MGAYIYDEDHGPKSDCILSSRRACSLVVEMIYPALQRVSARKLEEHHKKLGVEVAETGRGWFGMGETPIHNPDDIDADVLIEAHNELPYTLEAYLAWVSSINEETVLVHVMRKVLRGEEPDSLVMETFDAARDLIRNQALAGRGIYLSL